VRVLIADDNRLMLEGFRHALERVEDIEIVGATHSGAQVLGLVERRRPEIVVMDVPLRDADGRPCLDVVLERHAGIKLVVLSSSAAPDLVRSALGRGASAFIVKSVNPLDIPSALRQAYDQTVYNAIGIRDAPEDALRAAGLTEREITMLEALARGLSNKAISRELWLAEPTVKFHLGNLYRKLGVPNRLAAASYAHSHGLTASESFASSRHVTAA
jgi:DNA-binding NarL/FixJ family response regulator